MKVSQPRHRSGLSLLLLLASLVLGLAAAAGLPAGSQVGLAADPLQVTSADLAVTKNDSADEVTPDDLLGYTLTVANNGPANATGVVVTDILPPGVSLAATWTSQGFCSAGGVVTCTFGPVAAGAQATAILTVTIDSGTNGVILNTATVGGNQVDPNTANNTHQIVTTVIGDTIPPTVTWVAPVTAGVRFDVLGARSVRLRVQATDNEEMEKVRFTRWDAVNNQYVHIGEDFNPPYTWDLDTRTLNPEWNQVFAQGFDLTGNTSPLPPAAPFIWLYRWDLFLPLLSR